MAAILDGESIRKQVHPISVAFYHEANELSLIDERVELLQGVIFDKMPKSPLHRAIIRRLLKILGSLDLAGLFVLKEEPITTADSEPEPDIAIIRGNEDDFFGAHPTTAELVIEVAISSIELDRKKAEIYAEAGVKEYWIVMPKTGSVEVFTQLEKGRYAASQVYGDEIEVGSTVLPDIRVRIPELFQPPA
ncbi:MAG: Uma2 family endonuclease [Verrucomicrobiales bacterium]|jgi:Uma2 family endonuclease